MEYKVRSLRLILKKWNQASIETFTVKTREREIPETETDAILAGNLVEELKEYEKLLKTIQG